MRAIFTNLNLTSNKVRKNCSHEHLFVVDVYKVCLVLHLKKYKVCCIDKNLYLEKYFMQCGKIDKIISFEKFQRRHCLQVYYVCVSRLEKVQIYIVSCLKHNEANGQMKVILDLVLRFSLSDVFGFKKKLTNIEIIYFIWIMQDT